MGSENTAAAGLPARPPLFKEVPIGLEVTTEDAFGLIMKANLDYIRNWTPIAHDGRDIEGVHQLRVGLRRMRSALVVFRKAIPREVTDQLGLELKWAAGELGPARDLDVFIDEGLEAMAGKIPLETGASKMLELAKRHQEQAYLQVRAMIDGARYQKLLSDLETWIAQQGWRNNQLAPEVLELLGSSVRKYAIKTFSKRTAQVLADGADIATKSSEELHMLRIDCKKLRYATEFFSPLFDRGDMTTFITQLKGLQGVLGLLNDVSVMHGMMDGLLSGVDDPEIIKYAGALIGWRCRQYEEVRGNLGQLWNVFSATRQPWLYRAPVKAKGKGKDKDKGKGKK